MVDREEQNTQLLRVFKIHLHDFYPEELKRGWEKEGEGACE